jgi:hypothetical protein
MPGKRQLIVQSSSELESPIRCAPKAKAATSLKAEAKAQQATQENKRFSVQVDMYTPTPSALSPIPDVSETRQV